MSKNKNYVFPDVDECMPPNNNHENLSEVDTEVNNYDVNTIKITMVKNDKSSGRNSYIMKSAPHHNQIHKGDNDMKGTSRIVFSHKVDDYPLTHNNITSDGDHITKGLNGETVEHEYAGFTRDSNDHFKCPYSNLKYIVQALMFHDYNHVHEKEEEDSTDSRKNI